jgi:tripartite-type tricarboxylate transporter receptor subunit TctC
MLDQSKSDINFKNRTTVDFSRSAVTWETSTGEEFVLQKSARIRRRIHAGIVVACAAITAHTAFAADPPSGYFTGKQMNMIVYSSAGGTYDVYARLLARHMPDHLPGKPTFVVKNMMGAGGLTAARFLYVTAPKDGLTIGTIGRGLPFEPMLGGSESLDFDPLKFTWLGSMNKESSMAIAWHTAPVKTAQDLFKTELLTAATSASSDNSIIPTALNGLIGTKFKIVNGYYAISNAELALERGEAEGIGYWAWVALKSEKPDWLAEKKVNLLFQTGLTPHPDIPDVPTALSLAHNDEERECLLLLLARDVLGRPFVAPPNLPAQRVKDLKTAFIESLKDPALLDDARKTNLEINLVTPEEIEDLLNKTAALPQDVKDRTKVAMGR